MEQRMVMTLHSRVLCQKNVNVPVIASGGAGKLEHFYDVLAEGKADAVLAASLFHYGELSIKEVKMYLKSRGLGGTILMNVDISMIQI